MNILLALMCGVVLATAPYFVLLVAKIVEVRQVQKIKSDGKLRLLEGGLGLQSKQQDNKQDEGIRLRLARRKPVGIAPAKGRSFT